MLPNLGRVCTSHGLVWQQFAMVSQVLEQEGSLEQLRYRVGRWMESLGFNQTRISVIAAADTHTHMDPQTQTQTKTHTHIHSNSHSHSQGGLTTGLPSSRSLPLSLCLSLSLSLPLSLSFQLTRHCILRPLPPVYDSWFRSLQWISQAADAAAEAAGTFATRVAIDAGLTLEQVAEEA